MGGQTAGSWVAHDYDRVRIPLTMGNPPFDSAACPYQPIGQQQTQNKYKETNTMVNTLDNITSTKKSITSSIKGFWNKPRKTNYVLAGVLMAAFTAAVFYEGMQYQDNTKPQTVSVIQIPTAVASKAPAR